MVDVVPATGNFFKFMKNLNFLDYSKLVTNGGAQVSPFFEKVSNAFEDLSSGKIRKLICTSPPQQGKTYLSKLLVSWLAEKSPKSDHIVSSHSVILAKASKDFVKETISKHSSNYRGNILSVGVGGSVCGHGYGNLDPDSDGVGVFLLDSPLRGPVSDKALSTALDWYSHVSIRKLQKSAQVVFCTSPYEDSFVDNLLQFEGLYDTVTNPEGWYLVGRGVE